MIEKNIFVVVIHVFVIIFKYSYSTVDIVLFIDLLPPLSPCVDVIILHLQIYQQILINEIILKYCQLHV